MMKADISKATNILMSLMSWRIVHALLYLIKLQKHANDFWRIRGRVVVFLVDAEKGGRLWPECH
jgi:hypothetical protein